MIGNAELAAEVVALCCRLGVQEFLVAAGARNAPLIRALHDAFPEALTPFIDERSAGFFALGRIMESAAPVAVVTTSGTAVAELLPAVVEAHYQGRRLVVVSADRPQRYRGSGAPQAIEQVGIFGDYPVLELDLSADQAIPELASALPPGPVHLNVCLEEPRAEDPAPSVPVGGNVAEEYPEIAFAGPAAFMAEASKPLIVCGPMLPDEAQQLSDALLAFGAPVFAESASNLRGDILQSGLILAGGESSLRDESPDRVLRFGGVPTARWWRDLERSEVPVMHVSRLPFSGLARATQLRQGRLGDPMMEVSALENWLSERDRIALTGLKEITHQFPRSEPALVASLTRILPPQAAVFLGNSMPIRLWSMMAPCGENPIYVNRGANGIDGNLSTGLGIAAGGGETWIVVGDLTALYDLNACLILPHLKNCGNLRIVVINNGGGKIFARLPAFGEFPSEAQHLVENRHTRDFADFANLWGLNHVSVSESRDIEPLLGSAPAGHLLLELCPDPMETAEFWEALACR